MQIPIVNPLKELDFTAKSVDQKPFIKREESNRGIIIAFSIIGIWAVSLILFLSADISSWNSIAVLAAMAWQTFLYTGLFITAHDAMHGVAAPNDRRVNNLIGRITLFVYGLFSFKEMLRKHAEHHHHPASQLDPDFHDGKHPNFFAWYFHFMKGYWSWSRLIGLMIIYNVIHAVFHVPENNLTLFWVIPSILSSVQLFYFGTYLTHQEPEGGYQTPSRATTNALPIVWSFLTCYHFGYHEEHHDYPYVPWWQLPTVHQLKKAGV